MATSSRCTCSLRWISAWIDFLQLHGDRWNVETDLRWLKQTLNLPMLRCQSADMIAKESILAITGYHLVRAVMNGAPGATHRHAPAHRQRRYRRSDAGDTRAEFTPAQCCNIPDQSRGCEQQHLSGDPAILQAVAACYILPKPSRKPHPPLRFGS